MNVYFSNNGIINFRKNEITFLCLYKSEIVSLNISLISKNNLALFFLANLAPKNAVNNLDDEAYTRSYLLFFVIFNTLL